MKARSSDSGTKNSDSFFQDLADTAFKSLKSGFVKAVLGTLERRALSLLSEFMLLFLLLWASSPRDLVSARNEHQMSGQRFFMENFDPNTGEGHGAAPFTGRVSICSPNLTKSDQTDDIKLTWITRDEAWPAMADMAGWTTLVALIMADMPLELDFVLASESRTDLWEKRLTVEHVQWQQRIPEGNLLTTSQVWDWGTWKSVEKHGYIIYKFIIAIARLPPPLQQPTWR